MRNEMIGAVVRRAMEHPEFRRRLVENPQDALTSHGFALESNEMAEIERISATLGDSGDSGDDVEQKLVRIAEAYGINPR
jgi:hypothetical protein